MIWHTKAFSNNIPTNHIRPFLPKILKGLKKMFSLKIPKIFKSYNYCFFLPLKMWLLMNRLHDFKISSFTCYWTFSGSCIFSLGQQRRVKIPFAIKIWNSHMKTTCCGFPPPLTDCPELTAAKTVSNSAGITLTLHSPNS